MSEYKQWLFITGAGRLQPFQLLCPRFQFFHGVWVLPASTADQRASFVPNPCKRGEDQGYVRDRHASITFCIFEGFRCFCACHDLSCGEGGRQEYRSVPASLEKRDGLVVLDQRLGCPDIGGATAHVPEERPVQQRCKREIGMNIVRMLAFRNLEPEVLQRIEESVHAETVVFPQIIWGGIFVQDEEVYVRMRSEAYVGVRSGSCGHVRDDRLLDQGAASRPSRRRAPIWSWRTHLAEM